MIHQYFSSYYVFNVASSRQGRTNVIYNSSGGVTLPIPRNTIQNSTRCATNVSSLSAGIDPPPSYSDITNGKYLPTSYSRLHGQINFAMTPERDATADDLNGQERPPPYEAIHSSPD